jgi:hypothetical protein
MTALACLHSIGVSQLRCGGMMQVCTDLARHQRMVVNHHLGSSHTHTSQ